MEEEEEEEDVSDVLSTLNVLVSSYILLGN